MKHMLYSALFAGVAAGLLCALLQYLLVEPKILLAERYESGELVHFQGVVADASEPGQSRDQAATTAEPAAAEPAAAVPAAAVPAAAVPAAAEPAHDYGAGKAEEPSALQRHLMTVFFAIVTYCGYGLVLVAGLRLAQVAGVSLDPLRGLLWGLAGFLAFQLMPAVGLEPELPGTPGADLNARQMWWAVTAVATLVGLWYAAYGNVTWQRLGGLVILALPHVWGAPELKQFGGIVPPELASSFAVRSLAVGLATWALLGWLAVRFWLSEPGRSA